MTLFLNKYSKKNVKSVVFFVLITVLVISISGCGHKTIPKKEKESPEPNTTDADLTTAKDGETGNKVEPPQLAPENKDTQLAEIKTDDVSPDVPEGPAKDDDYFADAAFMGNSLMDGFRLFSGLTTCDYYAATSMTVVGADSNKCITLDNGNPGSFVEGLCQKPYGKIYILLGINEIGYNLESFVDMYSEMLDKIIAAQPDCDIYIMGLTPVSAEKSQNSDIFNMEHIKTFNTALRKLAKDKGIWYLDLVEALSGDDGYLPSQETSDGIHFSASVYSTWLDYVKTHYV